MIAEDSLPKKKKMKARWPLLISWKISPAADSTTMECDTADYPDSGNVMRRRYQSGNCLRRSSLFSLYAKIFRLLLGKWEKPGTGAGGGGNLDENSEEDEYSKELDGLVLPSNEDWRLRVYYRLVELQRENDHAEAAAALEDVIP